MQETNRRLEHALNELRAKNEEVHAMTQQLWQAAKLASVGELAASIAHELNNPLATVRLRIESVLAQTPADDRRRRPLEIIDQETKRMGDLVANLLQFSRRGVDELSTVDIRDELLKALELVQHHLRKRDITVVQEFAPDTPTIYADRQKLRQVFLNLLTNACDAMPQGGTLTLRSAPDTTGTGRAGRADRVLGHRRGHRSGASGESLGAVLHHQGGRARAPGWGWRSAAASCRNTTARSRSSAKWGREPRSASCCRSSTAPMWNVCAVRASLQ